MVNFPGINFGFNTPAVSGGINISPSENGGWPSFSYHSESPGGLGRMFQGLGNYYGMGGYQRNPNVGGIWGWNPIASGAAGIGAIVGNGELFMTDIPGFIDYKFDMAAAKGAEYGRAWREKNETEEA